MPRRRLVSEKSHTQRGCYDKLTNLGASVEMWDEFQERRVVQAQMGIGQDYVHRFIRRRMPN